MKRKHTRIIALIIVIAVVVTTVMSTVLAFADETDDYGYGYGDDWGDYDTPSIDYSQIAPAQSSYTLTQTIDGATLIVPLTGVPAGSSLDWSDLGDVTSSNPDMEVTDSDIDYSNQFVCLISGTGTTVISFMIGTKQISVTVTVNPKYDFSHLSLKKNSVVVCSQDSNASVNVGLNGLPKMDDEDSDFLTIDDVTSSNPDMQVDVWINRYDGDEVDAIEFDVNGVGETTVSFRLAGIPMQITIRHIQAWVEKTDYTISKGKTAQIKVKGDLQGLNPEYKSLKPSVATVSKSGKVKAKKNGATVIRITLGNTSDLGAVINVASAKKIKAFNWARKYAANNTYSQPKRMQKGYFDCSSLVWRAYRSQGITLMQKNYAPTAADLAQYLVKKHKKVASADWKNYQKMKFQVGDLLFETGDNNGRYKGIYHVEMFGGYTFGGFDADGKPILGIEFARLGGSTSSSDFLCRP